MLLLTRGVSTPKSGDGSPQGGEQAQQESAQAAEEAQQDARREQVTDAAVSAISMSGGGEGMDMSAVSGGEGMDMSTLSEGQLEGGSYEMPSFGGDEQGSTSSMGMNMDMGNMTDMEGTMDAFSPVDKTSITNGIQDIHTSSAPDTSDQSIEQSGPDRLNGLNQQNETGGSMNVDQLHVIAGNVVLDGNNIESSATDADDQIVIDNNIEEVEVEGDEEVDFEIDDGIDFDLSEGEKSLGDKILSIMETARNTGLVSELKDMGTDLYSGFNELRDTFAPTTAVSKDWQTTVNIRNEKKSAEEERRKERVEKVENKFVKNEGNKQFMMDTMRINGMSVMDYYQNKYEGQGKSDTYIREKAEERVEAELEKMKGYAKYGMDARQAYPLYLEQKKYGFTAEEAIRNKAGFERFDAHIGNVSFINDKYAEQGIHVERISEVVPNAREYYANGYRDIREILDLNYLEQKLNISCQRAMQIDSVLRKRGRIEAAPKKPRESEEAYRKRVEMYERINNMYKNKIQVKRNFNV